MIKHKETMIDLNRNELFMQLNPEEAEKIKGGSARTLKSSGTNETHSVIWDFFADGVSLVLSARHKPIEPIEGD